MRKIIRKDKQCPVCKKFFNRRISKSGRPEGIEDFDVRIFCDTECYKEFAVGENHPNFKGGCMRKDGYIEIHIPSRGKCYKHRYIMEKLLGRTLGKDECVHHIDENPRNNDINNLMLLSRSDHMKLHQSLRKAKENE